MKTALSRISWLFFALALVAYGDLALRPTGTQSTAYTYDSSHPHAVATAWGYTLGYDANGNVTTRTGGGQTWSTKWAGFDKPRWLAKNNIGSEFIYNAARSRVMHLEFDQVNASGVPSHYNRKRIYAMGATMEVDYRNTTAASTPTWKMDRVRIYVPGPEGNVGTMEFLPTAPFDHPERALVYHYDHLGSIERITAFNDSTATFAPDEGGKPARYSYDAWGQRRNADTWSGAPVATALGGHSNITPRGFTGHEMLDDIGLVHMNGRIYDPLLGRFLSADLLIQKPGSLQSYNRYSYVQNNPLTLTDPSGFADDSSGDNNEKTGLAWLISVLAPDTNSLPQSTRSAPEAGSIEAEVNDRVRAGFDKGVQVIEAEAKIVDAATGLVPGAQLGKDLAQLATGKDAIGRDVSRSDTTVRLAVGAAVEAGAKPVAELAGKLVGKVAAALSKEGETAVRIEGAAAKSGVKDEVKGVEWVDENASMSGRARSYNDSASGARSNVETGSPQAPQIQGKNGPVRFDGQEGKVMIDRKTGVATTEKTVGQAKRQSQALKENGMTGRWEVPDGRSQKRAQRVLRKAGADNIEATVVDE